MKKLAKNSVDLTGRKYGRLTVIEATEKRAYSGSVVWRCKCRCGGEKLVPSPHLRRGLVISCGCAAAEQRRIALLSHRAIQEELKISWEEIALLRARIAELEDETESRWATAGL